jgi:phosphatidylinositol alpha-mannosyltransferase
VVHLQAVLEAVVMKIGIVSQSYYPRPGGVTEVVHYTAKILCERGHDVRIITTSFNGHEPQDPRVIRIGHNMLVPMNGALVNMTVGIGLREKLARILEREAFDIVHAHCPLVPTLPLLVFKTAPAGQKLIGTFHAAAERNLPYWLFNRPLSRRIEKLHCRMAVSEAARAFISKYFPGSYEIVPNGVDCERFHPGVEPIGRFKDGALNVLFVGRMDRRKGVPYLLAAMPVLQEKLSRRVRLILVGERSARSVFMRRPFDMRGAEIVFAGRVSPGELPRYYATADVFCSPAIGQESFGIVLLEAMASGKPIVASDIRGYRTAVRPGVNGILVEPKSPEAIARAILMLAANPGFAASIGAHARQTALGYDWPIVVDALEAIYCRVAGVEAPTSSEALLRAHR